MTENKVPRASVEINPSSEEKGHWVIKAEQWLPVPVEELFPFFADARNLGEITPPWLKFIVLTPPPFDMKPGLLLDYKLKLRGIPIRWRTEITEWEPPKGFVDIQLKGPYKVWHHRHSFVPDEGGSLVLDEVVYRATGGWLANKILVQKDLQKVFTYRQQVLHERFGSGISEDGA